VSGTIALDPATVRYVAAKLVRAHQDLQQVPALAVEGGGRHATTAKFTAWVAEVTEVHAANRAALVVQLADLSRQLRASAADFQGLEEEYRSGLFALESEGFALAQAAREAQSQQAQAGGMASLLDGLSSLLGGVAPAGSGGMVDRSKG
jgi:hypothetical protein